MAEMKNTRFMITIAFFAMVVAIAAKAQPQRETGGQDMPDEWIDQDTHHKVIRLTRKAGNNASFYFHNDPFIRQRSDEGDLMVFYGDDNKGRNLYAVNLKTLATFPLTADGSRKRGEIVGNKTRTVFYQVNDSVFAVNADTRKGKLVFVFPEDFRGGITTLNADETLLGGVWATDQEKEISRKYPEKGDYFNRIFEAKLPRTLFTIDLKTKRLNKVFTDSAWLNHVQFSPSDPHMLMFCHEGPWHKLDRIWTINVKGGSPQLIHKRTMDMEIAGHEWFAPDGSAIWFDLQMPRGETFFVAGHNFKSGKEKRYSVERDEWSVHYTLSPDQKIFAGDGGGPTSVAKTKNGQWIYLFRPAGDHLVAEKLVNMKHHQYKFEPNVHFSPDGKWIIFRANFEGHEDIYAVEVEKSKSS
jgi:oligogalacturonide lyase